jgi:hypothetical protein
MKIINLLLIVLFTVYLNGKNDRSFDWAYRYALPMKTWTDASGERTFEGQVFPSGSFDGLFRPDGKFIIKLKNGKTLTDIDISMFCEKDRFYLNWLVKATFAHSEKSKTSRIYRDPFYKGSPDPYNTFVRHAYGKIQGEGSFPKNDHIIRNSKINALENEYNLKCVLKDRIDSWLKNFPYKKEFYRSIFVSRVPFEVTSKHTRETVVRFNDPDDRWNSKFSNFYHKNNFPILVPPYTSMEHIDLRTIIIFLGPNETVKDLTPLKKLPFLQNITLQFTNVKDLSPLKDHIFLTYFESHNSHVEDITPLRDLPKLRWVYLEWNKIKYWRDVFKFYRVNRDKKFSLECSSLDGSLYDLRNKLRKYEKVLVEENPIAKAMPEMGTDFNFRYNPLDTDSSFLELND